MTKKQKAIDVFERLGFDVSRNKPIAPGFFIYGTTKAEPINVGKDHFIPKYRYVYIGDARGGYYVTSNITGTMRLYRHKNSYETDIANIFGHGKTVEKALENFAYNFIHKIYNRGY